MERPWLKVATAVGSRILT